MRLINNRYSIIKNNYDLPLRIKGFVAKDLWKRERVCKVAIVSELDLNDKFYDFIKKTAIKLSVINDDVHLDFYNSSKVNNLDKIEDSSYIISFVFEHPGNVYSYKLLSQDLSFLDKIGILNQFLNSINRYVNRGIAYPKINIENLYLKKTDNSGYSLISENIILQHIINYMTYTEDYNYDILDLDSLGLFFISLVEPLEAEDSLKDGISLISGKLNKMSDFDKNKRLYKSIEYVCKKIVENKYNLDRSIICHIADDFNIFLKNLIYVDKKEILYLDFYKYNEEIDSIINYLEKNLYRKNTIFIDHKVIGLKKNFLNGLFNEIKLKDIYSLRIDLSRSVFTIWKDLYYFLNYVYDREGKNLIEDFPVAEEKFFDESIKRERNLYLSSLYYREIIDSFVKSKTFNQPKKPIVILVENFNFTNNIVFERLKEFEDFFRDIERINIILDNSDFSEEYDSKESLEIVDFLMKNSHEEFFEIKGVSYKEFSKTLMEMSFEEKNLDIISREIFEFSSGNLEDILEVLKFLIYNNIFYIDYNSNKIKTHYKKGFIYEFSLEEIYRYNIINLDKGQRVFLTFLAMLNTAILKQELGTIFNITELNTNGLEELYNSNWIDIDNYDGEISYFISNIQMEKFLKNNTPNYLLGMYLDKMIVFLGNHRENEYKRVFDLILASENNYEYGVNYSMDMAKNLLSLKEINYAITFYEFAIKLLYNNRDYIKLSEVLRDVIIYNFYMGDIKNMDNRLILFKKLAYEIDSDEVKLNYLYTVLETALNQKKYKLFEENIILLDHIKDEKLIERVEAVRLRFESAYDSMLGKFDVAMKKAETILNLPKKEEYVIPKAYAYRMLGISKLFASNKGRNVKILNESIEYYKKSGQLFLEALNYPEYLFSLNNIHVCKLFLEDYETCFEINTYIIETAKKMGLYYLEVFASLNMVDLYNLIGEYDLAKKILKETEEISRYKLIDSENPRFLLYKARLDYDTNNIDGLKKNLMMYKEKYNDTTKLPDEFEKYNITATLFGLISEDYNLVEISGENIIKMSGESLSYLGELIYYLGKSLNMNKIDEGLIDIFKKIKDKASSQYIIDTFEILVLFFKTDLGKKNTELILYLEKIETLIYADYHEFKKLKIRGMYSYLLSLHHSNNIKDLADNIRYNSHDSYNIVLLDSYIRMIEYLMNNYKGENAIYYTIESLYMIKNILENVSPNIGISLFNMNNYLIPYKFIEDKRKFGLEVESIENKILDTKDYKKFLNIPISLYLYTEEELDRYKYKFLELMNYKIDSIDKLFMSLSDSGIQNMEMIIKYFTYNNLAEDCVVLKETKDKKLEEIFRLGDSMLRFDKSRIDRSKLYQKIQLYKPGSVRGDNLMVYKAHNNSNNDSIYYICVISNKFSFPENEVLLEDFKKIKNLLVYLFDSIEIVNKLQLDKTTGALEKVIFKDILKRNHLYAKSNLKKYSLILIDIDYFKKVNDMYGHIFGDKVLRMIVKDIKAHLDENQVLGKIGGEEFLIYAPNLSKKEAFVLSEKIRESISELEYSPYKLKTTVSIGISSFPEDEIELNKLINFADKAMYKAKISGRNQTSLFNENLKTGELINDITSGIITDDPNTDDRHLRSLIEIMDLIANSDNKKHIRIEFLRNLLDNLDGEVGVLIKKNGESYQIIEKFFVNPKIKNKDLIINYNILKQADIKKDSVYLVDWDTIYDYNLLGRPKWKSVLTVPILKGNKTEGFIYIFTDYLKKEYNYKDGNLAKTFLSLINEKIL